MQSYSEDAGDVLLVGVDDVRVAYRTHFEQVVPHIQHLHQK